MNPERCWRCLEIPWSMTRYGKGRAEIVVRCKKCNPKKLYLYSEWNRTVKMMRTKLKKASA